MKLDWSEQSSHIRTMYAPWHPDDRYEEDVIQAVEAQMGSNLPTPLRTFYLAWGRRKDLTQFNQVLVGPDELIMRPDALIFCFENQAICSWAIRREDLTQTDPPVVVADALPDWKWSEIDAPLNWMSSHAHISDFLNTLTYHHALCGGAIHGGYTKGLRYQEYQNAWLEQYWHRTIVGP